jgi:hypothetical protein
MLIDFIGKARWDNPHKRKARAKLAAAAADSAGAAALAAPGPKRAAVQMPDEYLPPNKILFLQNLPEMDNLKVVLTSLFGQSVAIGYESDFIINVTLAQIPQPFRSSSYPYQERHRFRRVFGRR